MKYYRFTKSNSTDYGYATEIILFLLSLLFFVIPYIVFYFNTRHKKNYKFLARITIAMFAFIFIIVIILLSRSESRYFNDKLENESSKYSNEEYIEKQDDIKKTRAIGRVFYIILIILEIILGIGIFMIFNIIKKKLPPIKNQVGIIANQPLPTASQPRQPPPPQPQLQYQQQQYQQQQQQYQPQQQQYQQRQRQYQQPQQQQQQYQQHEDYRKLEAIDTKSKNWHKLLNESNHPDVQNFYKRLILETNNEFTNALNEYNRRYLH
jgi:hypothetical protein